jgi:hypothetical protein
MISSSESSSTQPKLGRNRYGQGIFPKARLGVDDYNDLTYSTLPAPATTPYPATASFRFYRQACRRTQASQDFPRAGVWSHRIPRARYSHLYTSQGISHIERILKYSHIDDDITGQLIRPWNNSSSRSGAMDPPYPYRMQIFPS